MTRYVFESDDAMEAHDAQVRRDRDRAWRAIIGPVRTHDPDRAQLCTEEVTRKGELEPCDKPAIGLRYEEDHSTYPVCAYHARRPMVPLHELRGQ